MNTITTDRDLDRFPTETTLEAELLALVPEEDRTAAEATLLLLLELAAGRDLEDSRP